VGTAPEQKTKSAKSGGGTTTHTPLFYKCIFDFIAAKASIITL